jgi:hypothetical protein
MVVSWGCGAVVTGTTSWTILFAGAHVAESYYVVLGVNADATEDQIRSAYRRKAKQWHPDCYEGSSQPFLDIQEAYEVLSDPARRQAYDDSLGRAWRAPIEAEPLRPRRCPVEPLIPTEAPAAWGTRRSPFEGMFDRLWGDLGGWARPDVGQQEIPIAVRLTRGQALRGGHVRTWLPVQSRCPTCRGYGSVGFWECGRCAGSGIVVEEIPVEFAFPASVADQDVVRVPLDPLGLHDACLRVRFRVSG